jgi:hypothetical protein
MQRALVLLRARGGDDTSQTSSRTSNTVHRCREPQSQHGANPDDSFGPLTGPSILTDPVISPCSGLCKVTGREMEY